MNLQEYNHVKDMDYFEYCDYLHNKYGVPQYNYMTPGYTAIAKCKRTSEGLFVHHKMEIEIGDLSKPSQAKIAPFEYQLSYNLVYCDYLEHLLLHILIAEHPNHGVLASGTGGAIDYLIPELNDAYSGFIAKQEWRNTCYQKVIHDKNVYIQLLKRTRVAEPGCKLATSAAAKYGWDERNNLSIYLEALSNHTISNTSFIVDKPSVFDGYSFMRLCINNPVAQDVAHIVELNNGYDVIEIPEDIRALYNQTQDIVSFNTIQECYDKSTRYLSELLQHLMQNYSHYKHKFHEMHKKRALADDMTQELMRLHPEEDYSPSDTACEVCIVFPFFLPRNTERYNTMIQGMSTLNLTIPSITIAAQNCEIVLTQHGDTFRVTFRNTRESEKRYATYESWERFIQAHTQYNGDVEWEDPEDSSYQSVAKLYTHHLQRCREFKLLDEKSIICEVERMFSDDELQKLCKQLRNRQSKDCYDNINVSHVFLIAENQLVELDIEQMSFRKILYNDKEYRADLESMILHNMQIMSKDPKAFDGTYMSTHRYHKLTKYNSPTERH